ncbi:YhcG family protein [Brachybacterium sp. FME24]|uniref:PDDEXK nuclease domain-containing protein n=1 Tax=Brachybacterium sp. FME24 TaxID=2742605 RepID=UPI0018673EFD|nr:PDDEXK nuclease domain-containing protein [Brachybacterium sp. FME24]
MTALVPDDPDDYASTLNELKQHVHDARFQAQRAANTELLKLYRRIGPAILNRQAQQAWGSKVLERLAADLRAEFPTMKGFSRRNLLYMRSFAGAWTSEDEIVQRSVALLPWGHVIELLSKLDDPELRDWYAAKDTQHGWTRSVLAHQITTRLHERETAAPSNLPAALDGRDSELAQQLTKDPYTLEFLALDSGTTERELGPGFAFVGRQVHFDVGGDDFYVDLLFFHVEQLRYVVIELKTESFDPRHTGQLGFYVALVDGQLRDAKKHLPTVGILLVSDKNDTVVRYALAGTGQPVAVSRYELSIDTQEALPDEKTLVSAFRSELDSSERP